MWGWQGGKWLGEVSGGFGVAWFLVFGCCGDSCEVGDRGKWCRTALVVKFSQLGCLGLL
jgi:hypothetical protein